MLVFYEQKGILNPTHKSKAQTKVETAGVFSWAVTHVAMKIKADLKATVGHKDCREITTEAAIKVIPESLFMLLRLLLVKRLMGLIPILISLIISETWS